MNVLWELWACDGVVETTEFDWSTCWQMHGDLNIVDYAIGGAVALANITPPFDSRDAINAAIHKVGPERIKKMFRSFKFIK